MSRPIRKIYFYGDRAGVEWLGVEEFQSEHIQDDEVALDCIERMLEAGESRNDDPGDDCHERYVLEDRSALARELDELSAGVSAGAFEEHGERLAALADKAMRGAGAEAQRYHRTTVTLTVLSEEKIGEMELSTLIRECEQGEYVLASVETKDAELTGKEMVDALYDAASEPGFFGLDNEGRKRED